MKNNRAITLIALVITIIVLIILAGVSITMLSGNNSILNQAGRARDITSEKSISEGVQLAYLGALANGNGSVTPQAFKEELEKRFGNDKISDENITQNADGSFTVSIDGVEAIAGRSGTTQPPGGSNLTDEEKTKLASNGIAEIPNGSIENNNLKDTSKIKAVITGKVPIPVGATYEEGTVNTGVVIKYKDSEFVWVPVPNAIYDSTKDDKLPKSSATGTLTNTDHEYTPMAINTGTAAEPVYKGLLYNYNATNGAYLLYPNASQYQGTTSQYREPAYLSGSTYDNNTTYGRLFTSNDLQQSYNLMVQSVAKYGGFFVGRYETSINKTTSKAQSIANVRPSNNSDNATKRWYGLYQKQKEFTENTDQMQSYMIWGSQWDAMLNWALTGADKEHVTAKNNSTHNDTYTDTTIRTRTTTETDSITETDIINNIYDLEGNLWEWTQEANSSSFRAHRGGDLMSSYSPSYRFNNGPTFATSYAGSRLSLYIK